MLRCTALLLLFAAPACPVPPVREEVSFATEDGAVIHGHLYGGGEHGVVLGHGARFDKESWEEQARQLAEAGFRVLALDFRGYGESKPPPGAGSRYEGLHHDVLGAVRFLRERGASRVSVIGGSMGGWAAGEAAVAAGPGEIDNLVLLAHSPVEHPERMQGRKLFALCREDPSPDGTPRLERIREQYERSPGPKELLVLECAEHAQHIFGSGQGERLLREIIRFLSPDEEAAGRPGPRPGEGRLPAGPASGPRGPGVREESSCLES